MEKITAIIKTKNADKTLCNILESIKTIDEIIALDDNSTDDTIDILKEYKAKIVYFSYNELDYALNQALADAMGDWILIVEQDEIIPSSLIEKLKNYSLNPKKNKYSVLLNQKVFYLNKELRAAANWTLRFFKKDCCTFRDNKAVIKKGKSLKIKPCFYKYIDNNIVNRLNNTLSQKAQADSRAPKVFINPVLSFFYYYFFKKAILDKKQGLIFALEKASNSFIQEVILFEKKEEE